VWLLCWAIELVNRKVGQWNLDGDLSASL